MEEINIRGEYWIQDGSVDFADGDIGDRNHEGIATDHVLHKYADNIVSLAEDLEIKTNRRHHYDEPDPYEISNLLSQIIDRLTGEDGEETSQHLTPQQAEKYVLEHLGADEDAFEILQGGGDARKYVMVHEGWIAVRENNAELYGYDTHKRESLARGLGEIVDNEIGSEEFSPEQVEISISDLKTGRTWYTTLEDLENPFAVHAQSAVTSTYKNKPIYNINPKDPEENKYSVPSKSAQNPWNVAAQKAGIIGPGQQLWRGTSESRYPSFLEWYSARTSSE